MHICYLTHEYPPEPHGGIGTFVQALGRRLVEAGHAVSVVGVWKRHEDAQADDHGVRVHRVRASHWPTARFLPNGWRVRKRVLDIHASHPIDLIEAADSGLALVGNGLPMPRVLRMHGGHHYFSKELRVRPSPWRAFLEKRSFRVADHVVAVSRHVGHETAHLIGLDANRIVVIPNFVDGAQFKAPPGIQPEHNRIFFMGTLCEKKGVRQLLLAMRQVVRTHRDARLVIAGRDLIERKTGRSYRNTVLEPLLGRELAGHVEFVGAIPHDALPEAIARSCICALPSHAEAMPLVWLEVLAVGRPLLGGDIGPGKEVLTDGVDGMLCDPHSSEAIAGRLERLLSNDEERETIARRGHETFLKRFSAEVAVQANCRFYASCIASRDKPGGAADEGTGTQNESHARHRRAHRGRSRTDGGQPG